LERQVKSAALGAKEKKQKEGKIFHKNIAWKLGGGKKRGFGGVGKGPRGIYSGERNKRLTARPRRGLLLVTGPQPRVQRKRYLQRRIEKRKSKPGEEGAECEGGGRLVGA